MAAAYKLASRLAVRPPTLLLMHTCMLLPYIHTLHDTLLLEMAMQLQMRIISPHSPIVTPLRSTPQADQHVPARTSRVTHTWDPGSRYDVCNGTCRYIHVHTCVLDHSTHMTLLCRPPPHNPLISIHRTSYLARIAPPPSIILPSIWPYALLGTCTYIHYIHVRTYIL